MRGRVSLESDLIRHEGVRLFPYKDSVGKLTIGIGRNLDDVGISAQEAQMMLENDVHKVRQAARQFHWYHWLDQDRKDVIANMIFNLGIAGFKDFEKMIAALERQDYALAAAEMLNSTWKTQVGQRAIELARRMRG
jgi:lysozyme